MAVERHVARDGAQPADDAALGRAELRHVQPRLDVDVLQQVVDVARHADGRVDHAPELEVGLFIEFGEGILTTAASLQEQVHEALLVFHRRYCRSLHVAALSVTCAGSATAMP